MPRRPHVLPLAWTASLAVAGAVAARSGEGTLLLQRRDGTPAGELVLSPRPARLLREGQEPLAAEAAVQAGARLYALFRSRHEPGDAGPPGEELLGVYRVAGSRATEERLVRVGADAPAAPRPRAASLEALLGGLQELLGSPRVARDLAALRDRGVELELEARRVGPMDVDQAETLLSADSRTRLARQALDSRSALVLFRLGALRDPPPSREGVRALSDLLRREIVPGRFVRTHLLLGAGRIDSRSFGAADELETWTLLAETPRGELLAVRAEWRVAAPE